MRVLVADGRLAKFGVDEDRAGVWCEVADDRSFEFAQLFVADCVERNSGGVGDHDAQALALIDGHGGDNAFGRGEAFQPVCFGHWYQFRSRPRQRMATA